MKHVTVLEFLTPAGFNELIASERGNVICALLHPIHLTNRVFQDLITVAETYGQDQLKVKVFDPEFLDYFSNQLKIPGAPAYLLFFAGLEQRRFLGIADLGDLRGLLAGPAVDVSYNHATI
ncbi:hypothetical protein [Desulfocurvus sp. DL9XJH121]